MTINLANIPEDISGIPDAWIYHYYLNLKEPLDGRRIRIKSPFTNEKTPSMFLYVNGGKYRWKDHSSGEVGSNPISLTKSIMSFSAGYELSYKEVIDHIKYDYNNWTLKHGSFKPLQLETEYYAYSLNCFYQIARYEEWDYKYWETFNVTQRILERFNVFPLRYFQLYKETEHGRILYAKKSFRYSYGIFLNDGTLVKIYNPFYDDLKHINLVKDFLGREQLTNDCPACVILSGLKDMLCAASFDLDFDVCAGMSEKSLIVASDMDKLKDLYPFVFTLFDNDSTGIRAMMRYQEIYNVDYIYLPYKKDLSETFEWTKDELWLKHELSLIINKKMNITHIL